MKHTNPLLPRLVRHLMWNASFISNIGLLNGKMGITIFFYHYAKQTKNKLYESFAGDLLDEVYSEIHIDTPKNFQDGLCGIAWGIEYLIRHNFAKANADEILEDIDAKIMEWDVRHIKDRRLETGLKGIAHYAISRCHNRPGTDNILLQSGYIKELIRSLKSNAGNDPEEMQLIEKLNMITEKKEITENMELIRTLSRNVKFRENNIFDKQRPIGILNNGYAGIAFNYYFYRKIGL